MSGQRVSAAHEKIIGPLAGHGSASPNGNRGRVPAAIPENASDSIGSRITAIAAQDEPARPCRETLGCRDAGAHPGRVNAKCCRLAAPFNGFAEFRRDRLSWTQRQRLRRRR